MPRQRYVPHHQRGKVIKMKSNEFSVATYNMLAKSLGTNTIPWVMNVSPSIRQRIEEVTPYPTFQQWVDSILKPEYLHHFHKNFASGNYAAMRSFWGAPTCQSSEDIPTELNGLTWVREDVVAYTTDDPSISTQQATSLRGMSKLNLPNELFQEFFHEILSKEQGIYSWKVRGPRIFDKITSEKPEIISIQEYDCHDVMANYRTTGSSESFSQAMASIGYNGVFLKDPLLGRDPPSGIGVFWEDSSFETVAGISGMESVDCNTHGFGGSVFNVDLEERWHSNDSAHEESELMKAADRRNGVICRLRHKSTGRIVSLCTAHLMTTSRDSAKTNKFPGEVRSGELAALRSLVESQVQADDALVLVGDFNTDAKDAKNLFSGQIEASDSAKLCEFETGFDISTEIFEWDTHRLKDAFAAIHRWGEGVGEDKYCTSRNANRVEWIDYIYYDCNQLETLRLSDCQTPSSLIPDERNPSDHVPLIAKFRFTDE